MKTSHHDTVQIEKYLTGNLHTKELLLFKVRLLVEPALRTQVALQKRVYALIKMYGRRNVRADAEEAHRQLFQNPGREPFQQKIFQYFIKSS